MAKKIDEQEVLDIFEGMSSSEVKTPHYRSVPSEEEQKEEEKAPIKDLSNATIAKRVMRGDLLTSQAVKSQLLVGMLIVLGFIVVVGMRYRVEKLQKEKIAIEERIGSLREHKIQMQKNYQESVKISNIAEQLDTLGVGLISGPPYAIEY